MENWFFSLRELEEHRADAESLMAVTLAAYSPGTKTRDSDGVEHTSWTPEGTTNGKASGTSRRQLFPASRTANVGGVERTVIAAGLAIPISAPAPSVGWEYQVTAIGPGVDPDLLGRRYHVVAIPTRNYASSRRMDVVEVPAL